MPWPGIVHLQVPSLEDFTRRALQQHAAEPERWSAGFLTSTGRLYVTRSVGQAPIPTWTTPQVRSGGAFVGGGGWYASPGAVFSSPWRFR